MKVRYVAAIATATLVGFTSSFAAVSSLSANATSSMNTPEEGSNATEAELIPAVGTEGQQGWVYSEDLDGPTPSSPEEALRWQEERIEQGGRYIALYAEDGSTVIGAFHVLAPHGVPTK